MAAAVGPIKISQRKSIRIKFQKRNCLSNDIQSLQVCEEHTEREREVERKKKFSFSPENSDQNIHMQWDFDVDYGAWSI